MHQISHVKDSIAEISSNQLFVADENELSPKLNLIQRPIVLSAISKNKCYLSDSNPAIGEELEKILNHGFRMAKYDAGWKAHQNLLPVEQGLIMQGLKKEIDDNGWLTLEEVKYILDQGIRGHLDSDNEQSYSLNARTFGRWIRHYNARMRGPAMSVQMQHIETPVLKTAPGNYQWGSFKEMEENYHRLFKIYEQVLAGNMDMNSIPEPDWMAGMYLTFVRIGILNPTNRQKNNVYAMIHDRMGKPDLKSESVQEKVRKASMIHILKEFLVEQAEDGIDLREHIRSTRNGKWREQHA